MPLTLYKIHMKEFIAPNWHQILINQGLSDFETLWSLKLKPLDRPNTGRGRSGWSTVTLLPLECPDGREERFIVKRQQNHTSRTIRHPFRGVPTFEKEFYNILYYKRLGIPTIEPVYYAQRNSPDGIQAVLVTEYLKGYQSLNELETTWQEHGRPDRAELNRLIKAMASLIGKLHSKGLQHNSLYPKHLFIQQKGDKTRVRLIDLETTKQRPFGNWRRIRDLESLHRRARGWSRIDRLRFYKTYCDVECLDKNAKRLCLKILKRNKKKVGQ